MADGFFKLGELVGGGKGGGTDSPAYIEGMRSGYQAQTAQSQSEKARDEARIMRSRVIAREAIPDAVAQAEYAENQRALLANVLLANNTLDLDQLGKLAVPQAGPAYQAAAEAAGAGNTDLQNRQTALATGKPYEPFKVQAGGDVLLNAGTGEHELTALGDAALEATNALAGSRNASAGASRAREENTRDRTANPDRYRAPPKAGKADDPNSEANVLAQARAAIAAGADPEAVRKRMRERGYSNVADKL